MEEHDASTGSREDGSQRVPADGAERAGERAGEVAASVAFTREPRRAIVCDRDRGLVLDVARDPAPEREPERGLERESERDPARESERESAPERAGQFDLGLERSRARAAWRAAATFDALRALGAAFLEGRCAHFPGWGAPDPDVETDAIVAHLVALHARGFLSVASQPAFDGRREGRAVRQRAFVAGFATRALASKLLASSSLVVRAWHADGTSEATDAPSIEAEPMTIEDGVARVVTGHAARAEELALFADEIGAEALRELEAASYVTAWDPRFGRAELLWNECARLAAN